MVHSTAANQRLALRVALECFGSRLHATTDTSIFEHCSCCANETSRQSKCHIPPVFTAADRAVSQTTVTVSRPVVSPSTGDCVVTATPQVFTGTGESVFSRSKGSACACVWQECEFPNELPKHFSQHRGCYYYDSVKSQFL